jgi:hypothetical protein
MSFYELHELRQLPWLSKLFRSICVYVVLAQRQEIARVMLQSRSISRCAPGLARSRPTRCCGQAHGVVTEAANVLGTPFYTRLVLATPISWFRQPRSTHAVGSQEAGCYFDQTPFLMRAGGRADAHGLKRDMAFGSSDGAAGKIQQLGMALRRMRRSGFEHDHDSIRGETEAVILAFSIHHNESSRAGRLPIVYSFSL